MAKEEATKNVLERDYVVPLRCEWGKSARYKRAKKASTALREFLVKHMKADPKDIKIGKELNDYLWRNGMRNPPHKVKIHTVKDNKGIVRANIEGVKIVEEKKEVKKAETPLEKVKAKMGVKDERKKEEPSEETKSVEKEEIKELEKESKEVKHHAPKTEAVEKKVEQEQTAPEYKR